MKEHMGPATRRLAAVLGSAEDLLARLASPLRVLAAALGLGAVLLLVLGPAALAAPQSCGTCHAAAGAYSSWKSSAHASVRCERCHTDRAALGGLGNSFALLSDIARLAKIGDTRTSRVESDACESCHSAGALARTVVDKAGLRMSHSGLSDGGYRCVDCHAGVAHRVSAVRVVRPTMSMCAHCHNNIKVSGKCEVCHTGSGSEQIARQVDPEWSRTHGPQWRKLHGMGDLATCTMCHGSSECESCHAIPMPHSGSFISTHGKTAIAKPTSCTVCHAQSFCRGCHGIEMPHPETFISGHAAAAGRPDAKCMACHVKTNCDECHEKHVHPGGAAR